MKVAMYVRVSTYRQTLTQTIEQQLQILYEYSQAHEWPWQEEGSGTNQQDMVDSEGQ